MVATALAIGVGVAAAAFFVRSSLPSSDLREQKLTSQQQGRAGLVALKRYRGGANALGRAFYKGGFEKTMNRREAALILETPYVITQ